MLEQTDKQPMTADMTVSLVYLGRIDYDAALVLQQQLSDRRKQNLIGDVLLLLEHPPVLTLGRNASRQHIVAGDDVLNRRGIRIVETNRGGDVTYHGPGQLVGYPILDLRGFAPRMGAVDYVRKLEEVLIRSCADYGILTERIPGRTGVWTVPGGAMLEKKIAAIGVHVSRAVTSHGFALNVTADLKDFDYIVPCGISDRGVTSIEEEVDSRLHSTPALPEVSNSVARHFGRVFGRPIVWLESLEALQPAFASPAERQA
jgi:lipoyl(octanoyl) transferase